MNAEDFLQESHPGRRKRQELDGETLFPCKRFQTILRTCQTTLQDKTETQVMMGQRAGLHLYQNCLDTHLLGPLLKFDLRAGEVAQWLGTLVAHPEEPGLILSTHMLVFYRLEL
jgi:hypothetical protein